MVGHLDLRLSAARITTSPLSETQSIQGSCEVWPSIGQLHEIECDGEKGVRETRSPTGVGRCSYFGGFHHSMVASKPSMRLRKSF
jgi:hypothetical protein